MYEAFQTYLRSRNQDETQIAAAVNMVDRYLAFKGEQASSSENLWDFSRHLIESGENTVENYLALYRYGYFSKDNALYIAVLELLDGEEALANLYEKLGQQYGSEIQQRVFSDYGVPPLGTPTSEKPRYTAAVMNRMAEVLDEVVCKDIIKDSLRTLPDSMYTKARERFAESKNLDDFMDREGEAFLAELEACMLENRLFFAQVITPEVMDYLRQHPEIYRGERQGNVVYDVKIPFMTREFLQAEDERSQRYYYCHCPWVRESIRNENEKVPGSFCNCSAGFHKKKWEMVYQQPLRAEVLESVLKGDQRCRFAIYLPEDAI